MILNDKQKEYIWDALDMGSVYAGEHHKYAKFATAKIGEWRLDKNNDTDYPYSLFVCIDYWDDLTKDFVDKVLNI